MLRSLVCVQVSCSDGATSTFRHLGEDARVRSCEGESATARRRRSKVRRCNGEGVKAKEQYYYIAPSPSPLRTLAIATLQLCTFAFSKSLSITSNLLQAPYSLEVFLYFWYACSRPSCLPAILMNVYKYFTV